MSAETWLAALALLRLMAERLAEERQDTRLRARVLFRLMAERLAERTGVTL